MRDYRAEAEKRATWIQETIRDADAKGVIFGNSGGKDSALVGILCKIAAELGAKGSPSFSVLGIIMPCGAAANYGTDLEHAELLARVFGIDSAIVDLTPCKDALTRELLKAAKITSVASANISPRLRMTTLYALGQSHGYLVAGTSNKSEYYTGYFTKWGDGAYDFNPIADLLATEVFEFLQYLGAPAEIIGKPPSAGLFEGQTDEDEMGVSYAVLDKFIQTRDGHTLLGASRCESASLDTDKIRRMHSKTVHKRQPPKMYGG